MSVETRAHFVRRFLDLQVNIASLNASNIPDEVDDVFEELTSRDVVDFWGFANNEDDCNHYTKDYEDAYGNHLRVATLEDVYNAFEKYKGILPGYSELFKNMVKAFLTTYPDCHFLVFIEQY